ncbi:MULTISPECIES: iron export ABC transporter permease subunit FetB [unclassified Exiguobacterium]|uniref:ABC transporter permease n=1 Tax=unclassified Exiguobacterium TaxID=2644629 RepID=UPI000B5915B0|nr:MULTISPECIES: iron export ABC transporter permease subunit FetB [unclassified Exiguobacterium]ASI35528.1 iron export ABC transporter permease subunit FetB [Exiguobacterium sp. N4-1P]ASI37537.1 iron export ABC transporter permease subunit FetB [Exiguobacterium sp. N4-1P]
MSYVQLASALVFILIPLVLTYTLKLGLGNDILIATVRSIVQLLIVGYLLTFVFESDSKIYIGLMILLMIVAATLNIIKKGDGIPGITGIILLTLVSVEVLTMGIMLGLRIIPFEAQEVIPISGMVIGNCMILSLLFLNKFKDEVERGDEVIELILALGGSPKTAIDRSLKSAIKTSMIPTIEAQKTMGLVQLPGMMSGLIIGGADPMEAVMYQLLILFLILTNAAVSSVMVGYLSYRKLFNQKAQFLGLTYRND